MERIKVIDGSRYSVTRVSGIEAEILTGRRSYLCYRLLREGRDEREKMDSKFRGAQPENIRGNAPDVGAEKTGED